MRSSHFAEYARVISNLLFVLAGVAVALDLLLLVLVFGGDESIYRLSFGDTTRGGLITLLIISTQWLLIALVLGLAGLGVRLLGRFATVVDTNAEAIIEALGERNGGAPE